ncbi:XkdX family protein [Bacillus velezensis]|uniref:XkdX family protein n=1 Tax=Bacillus velezensis TaxID=492670 RepID=UPI000BA6244D|nr:XkdX family protein [Bacillus velezensis]MED3230297.1 XkdX family protein [Bacillus velezensis]PAK29655.1 XkdX family protein [Bacillus velezensis]
MDWYNSIKGWYERGFWTKEMVAGAVRYGKITSEQYKEITGEAYPTPSEVPSGATDGATGTE